MQLKLALNSLYSLPRLASNFQSSRLSFPSARFPGVCHHAHKKVCTHHKEGVYLLWEDGRSKFNGLMFWFLPDMADISSPRGKAVSTNHDKGWVPGLAHSFSIIIFYFLGNCIQSFPDTNIFRNKAGHK